MVNTMRYTTHLTALLVIIAATLPAAARNIDLATVPARDTVQLTIYNAEDLTLVRETRKLTFKQGVNPLQFSWANTLIDPSSVELKFLTRPDELSLLDTTYPHDKPQMLYWNVQSEFDGEATVEISYFTSGISWAADYVGITTPDESTMHLTGYVTVINNSGEDYENAQIRLVVGTINLVEQIAHLARKGMGPRSEAEARASGMRRALNRADQVREMEDTLPAPTEQGAIHLGADSGVAHEAKQIVKEGLSEYFIFTVEGTETVPNRWRKRMRSFEADEAPVKIQYRYRPREYGNQLVRMYLLKNDEEADMGQSPLPNGQVRLFKQKEAGGLAYLASQSIKYIPIGEDIELNLGKDPNVVFELQALRVFRDNIWATLSGRVVRRLDGEGVAIDDRGSVQGWNEHTIYQRHIRNYTGGPIDVEIRRAIGGDITVYHQLPATLYDFQTMQLTGTIEAGATENLRYEVVRKLGRNAVENRVKLVEREPAPVPWLD